MIQERHVQHRLLHRLRIRPGIRGRLGAIPRNQAIRPDQPHRLRARIQPETPIGLGPHQDRREALEARRNPATLPTAVHPAAALAGAPAEVEETQGEAAVNLPPKS